MVGMLPAKLPCLTAWEVAVLKAYRPIWLRTGRGMTLAASPCCKFQRPWGFSRPTDEATHQNELVHSKQGNLQVSSFLQGRAAAHVLIDLGRTIFVSFARRLKPVGRSKIGTSFSSICPKLCWSCVAATVRGSSRPLSREIRAVAMAAKLSGRDKTDGTGGRTDGPPRGGWG